MNRRTFEGPMDWEYQNGPPVDMSSPFAKLSQRQNPFSESPGKRGGRNMNPFAASAQNTPARPQQSQEPPHSSFFNPQIPRPTAPQFRNPAFTTPQRRVDELQFSEMSGVESSPAMTEMSDALPETPDREREDDARATTTPYTANRTIFSKSAVRSRTPGRGELARGNRDKIRKRKRLQTDRDVGSVRPRLHQQSDESDSDWEASGAAPNKRGRSSARSRQGWFGNFLATVGNHPTAPIILAKWLQLAINIVLVGALLWGGLTLLNTVRSDLAHATEKARSELLGQMTQCKDQYFVNRCSPKADRLPAVAQACEEWEACMNQDQDAVMKVQVSAKNFAEIINEFVGVMSLKSWVFVGSLFGIMILANNLGFGHFRETYAHQAAQAAPPLPSAPAGPPMLSSPHHDPNQAYIWAPISQTPRHIRRNLFAGDGDTDTDNSPPPFRMLPPQTPHRRSPVKGDRGRSPAKARSPSKGY